jgi:[acyl-carrier-protein] S-malonyltransferase
MTMSPIAFLFPGQGSQYVGMAKDFYDADADSRDFMNHADALLGVPLTRICFTGPEDELRQTQYTQPAIFLHSIVVARKLTGLRPGMVAGHSLGEYSALVVAGAIGFDEALRLVHLRGQLMQKAGEEQQGTMAAIVGLAPDLVESLCLDASTTGIVQPANFNSPGQIVISGSVPGVRKAMELSRQHSAKMVKELVVSGAFHSPLMETARQGLKHALDLTTFRDAAIPVYANVTAEPVTRAADIRELLYRQLTSPVRWEQTIKNMARDGAATFYELGPGKVLQGLTKRTFDKAQPGGFDKYSDTEQQHRGQ